MAGEQFRQQLVQLGQDLINDESGELRKELTVFVQGLQQEVTGIKREGFAPALARPIESLEQALEAASKIVTEVRFESEPRPPGQSF